jgi:hypothetical protein
MADGKVGASGAVAVGGGAVGVTEALTALAELPTALSAVTLNV